MIPSERALIFSFSPPTLEAWQILACASFPLPTPKASGTGVEVAATTLYEAATLAAVEFRRCGWTEGLGLGTRLSVSVRAPATSHEVQWSKIEAWLQSAGKPNEQAMKGRLRELLRA